MKKILKICRNQRESKKNYFLKYKIIFCFTKKVKIYLKTYTKFSPLKPEILINKKGKHNKINKNIFIFKL